ncbi:MAG: hypothetical protein M1816_002692 [Peltula sp. TS41687]|nr:MAG: hypothetical protein M1816_002692 [Peltula sp. TS41687]
MAKIILSINAGSSSVKISVYKAQTQHQSPEQLVETQIAGLTAPPSTFSYATRSGAKRIKNQPLAQNINSQDEAFRYMLDHLVDDEATPEIRNREDIVFACHRIVHGGDYADAQIITAETFHHLEELTDLAPLHNASALSIVRSCVKQLPKTKNIAYFDSAFHQTIPEHIRTYPIDPAVARKNKLRKYGFHGISYSFIARSVAEYLNESQEDLNIITLHLGSGASACAIRKGKSLDTSMGLTPLAGLPGATRSGSIDPSLVFHFTSDAGKPSPNSTKDMHISTAEEILNKQSGWKALTGTTDFGKIASAAQVDDADDFSAQSRLAFSIFVDRITGFIGSYFVSLEGQVDALVFAGGIGEKSALLRARVVEQIKCLGFEIDAQKNEDVQRRHADEKQVVVDVGSEKARFATLVCWTDEQFEMARGCVSDQRFWGEERG